MDLIKIGKFIAKCRKEKNLTQEQLAEKLNITDRAVSKWERGLSLPDASIMIKLCNILDINVNELLIGEKIMNKDYNEKTEELLVELARQDEMKNKKIIVITAIASIVCILFYIAVAIFASYSLGEGTTLNIVMIISTIVLVVSLFVIIKFEIEAGYHDCKHCHEKFVPSYMQAFLAPHMGYTRYLKCPKCNKRSWAKKVMSKK